MVIIHYTDRESSSSGKKKAVVREDKPEDVANGDMCARDNSLDILREPLSPADIVHRARSRVSAIESPQ